MLNPGPRERWERGRPARTRPGIVVAICLTWINPQSCKVGVGGFAGRLVLEQRLQEATGETPALPGRKR